MNKHLDLKEKLHLKKVILNPFDRSQDRYKAILEWVKEKVEIEHWEQEGTKKREAWIFLHLPDELSHENKRHYSKYIEYSGKTEPKIEKGIVAIAQQVFKDY
jgi:sulfur transfer protein SufE